jgi:hypothetical protein
VELAIEEEIGPEAVLTPREPLSIVEPIDDWKGEATAP